MPHEVAHCTTGPCTSPHRVRKGSIVLAIGVHYGFSLEEFHRR